MSSSGITSINELPRSNIQNNNVHQEYMMQQQPQNIVLSKNEILDSYFPVYCFIKNSVGLFR
jgi:hypothetical protein